jgi:membrane protease YdiL (CAAX protease family)
MNQDNPLLVAGVIAAMAVVAWYWWSDYRAGSRGAPVERGFPGATPATLRMCLIGVGGALVLLSAEVAGEYALDLVEQQSRMTVLFGLYTLAAAFGEELVFRGYLFVGGRGPRMLWASIVACSLVFALAHPFLWRFGEDGLEVVFGSKEVFSTTAVFAGSVWFYWLRFNRGNPTRSLVPCIVAHATKNAGVFAVKAAQGFVVGWW